MLKEETNVTDKLAPLTTYHSNYWTPLIDQSEALANVAEWIEKKDTENKAKQSPLACQAGKTATRKTPNGINEKE